jgi:hypothetical protein
MNEVVIIVEGETEQTFVRDQLIAHLALRHVNAWPVLSGMRRNQGGVKKWEIAQQDIIRTLKERRYCSTMFDYYAMPMNWPGRNEATAKPWPERAKHVEAMLHAAIVTAMGDRFDPHHFIPYVELHEFEALAFANVEELASVLAPIGGATEERLTVLFNAILSEAGHPEAIDDGYKTCPSRRIGAIVPAYRKRVQGPIVTKRIGIDVLRKQCTHFGGWLAQLEQLGADRC